MRGIARGICANYCKTKKQQTCFGQACNELAVGQAILTSCCIDTLNPKSTEVALFVTTIAESISQTLLPSILGYGPNILAGTIVTAGEFENSLTFCS